MLSTIKSVKEYTNIDLFLFYSAAVTQNQLFIKAKELNPTLEFMDFVVDADFEARQHLKRAQGLVEIYIGKDEIDIENASDLLLLDKMVAYQSVYMLENENIIWNQVALTSQAQTDFLVNFDTSKDAPWIAPLVVIAAKGLSFKKGRSLRTGKVFQFPDRMNKMRMWRNS